jgi:hypothetical protein
MFTLENTADVLAILFSEVGNFTACKCWSTDHPFCGYILPILSNIQSCQCYPYIFPLRSLRIS